MKLLLELLTLILLFVLFRGAVRRFLPKKAKMQSFSPESLKALRKFRMRYFQLLLLFIAIFGTVFYLILVYVKNLGIVYSSVYPAYFPLKDSAFWQPALLGGLLVGSLVAFRLNRKLQQDGLSFYLEELQELAQGYQSFGTFRVVQYSLGLVLFLFLSYSAMSTGLGIDGQSIKELHPWRQHEVYKVNAIKKLNNQEVIQLLINEQDTINISQYKIKSEELNRLISDFKNP